MLVVLLYAAFSCLFQIRYAAAVAGALRRYYVSPRCRHFFFFSYAICWLSRYARKILHVTHGDIVMACRSGAALSSCHADTYADAAMPLLADAGY